MVCEIRLNPSTINIPAGLSTCLAAHTPYRQCLNSHSTKVYQGDICQYEASAYATGFTRHWRTGNIGERKISETATNIVGPSRNLLKEMPPTYQSMLGARYYNSSLPELVARVTGQGTNNPESKLQAKAWIVSQLKYIWEIYLHINGSGLYISST